MAASQTYTLFETIFEEPNNSTDVYDYTTGDYDCEEEGPSLTSFYTVFKCLLYSLIFLLGVAGNGLMIIVLLRRRRQLRITEIYLLHLALADLMLLFRFPFDVVSSGTGWIFGEFLCKIMGMLGELNLHCGSFLLACIGFDRYLAIVHAIPSMQTRRPKVVHLTCLVLWLVCLGLSVPHTVFLTVTKKHENSSWFSCSYHGHGLHSHNWVLTNRVLHHLCFFLPLAIMSYCYTALVITLCKSQKKQAKKGAIRLALLVTLVFCLCWLPYNITLLISTLVDLQVILYETCSFAVLLKPSLDVTKSLGLSHCCLNPFLYAFVGVRFRNELIQLLCKWGCGRICLPFMRAQGRSRSSTSDGATSNSGVFTSTIHL